ncbi:MAG: phosphopantetheine-binding protein [Candidatus Acidiferrales bacterium]
MSALSERELVELAVGWVRQNGLKSDLADQEIGADTDLMSSGLLDSLGFVDLIVYIEIKGGCKIDLTNVEPAEFSVVKGLCRLALKDHQ